ncbi:hypothetical protein BHU61_06625 [Macrococcus epidermidis]|uniref:YopX protein domain-containing protein n=1 Tax=Macrococcus epidermidis TaxID=1902580 RepID=A0A327ZRU1_9STAP|nr:YopX family protein [Macrococcus epidermidis]RAK44982.1 hypothetical protein BHU61_06625 [Macrococcus epidermidis]
MILKFRAWDKKKKEMFNVIAINMKLKRVYETWNEDGKNLFAPLDGTILMQSTGLTDKNGKEIFEGDIVKAWSEGYCGTFQVKWRNEGAPMYILYPAWQNEQFWNLHGNSIRVDDGIEIIGNIHESPDLLNT